MILPHSIHTSLQKLCYTQYTPHLKLSVCETKPSLRFTTVTLPCNTHTFYDISMLHIIKVCCTKLSVCYTQFAYLPKLGYTKCVFYVTHTSLNWVLYTHISPRCYIKLSIKLVCYTNLSVLPLNVLYKILCYAKLCMLH